VYKYWRLFFARSDTSRKTLLYSVTVVCQSAAREEECSGHDAAERSSGGVRGSNQSRYSVEMYWICCLMCFISKWVSKSVLQRKFSKVSVGLCKEIDLTALWTVLSWWTVREDGSEVHSRRLELQLSAWWRGILQDSLWDPETG